MQPLPSGENGALQRFRFRIAVEGVQVIDQTEGGFEGPGIVGPELALAIQPCLAVERLLSRFVCGRLGERGRANGGKSQRQGGEQARARHKGKVTGLRPIGNLPALAAQRPAFFALDHALQLFGLGVFRPERRA